MSYTPPTGAGNVTTNSATSGNSLTASKQSNLADGDLQVLVVYKQLAGSTFTTPSGFTAAKTATTSGTRGFAVFVKPITSAAGEGSTYTVASSDSSSRWIMAAFRLPGMASSWNDSAGTDVYLATSQTTVVDSTTAVAASTLALQFSFTNNSTAIFQTFSSSGWTNLLNTTVTSGSSTSVLDVEYKELTSAGSTGSVTFTMSPAAASSGGFMLTAALATSFSASPALSGSGTLTAEGTGTGGAAPSLTGSGSLSTAATLATSGTATLGGSGLLTTVGAPGGTDLATWLALPGAKYCAHRDGFYSTLGEFTVAGFQALTAWNPDVAWNIDVYKTSDGEYVASHDQTTGRVLSGASLDIPTNTWASISGKTTTVGGNPVARLDDIVAVAPAGTIFFIDNKANNNTTAFFSKLTALGLSPSNVVNKNFIGSTGMLTAARSNGYTTWGYGFDADMAAFASNHASADWLGFDYNGSQANWDTVIGYGQPSFAHILGSTANKTTADSKANSSGGTNFGYMVSAVSTVIPAEAAPSLTGSGTLSAVGTSGSSGTASLAGSGTLSASATFGVLAVVALAGGGSLTTGAQPQAAATGQTTRNTSGHSYGRTGLPTRTAAKTTRYRRA